MLGLAHRLENEVPRCIEHAGHDDLAVRRGCGLERVAICDAAYGHAFSPSLSFPAGNWRVDPDVVPRCAGNAPPRRPLPSMAPARSGTAATGPRVRGR